MGSQPKSTDVEEETGKSPAAAQTHPPFYRPQKLFFQKIEAILYRQPTALFVCFKNHNLSLEGV